MSMDRMLKARLSKYAEDYELKGLPEDRMFELFVNAHIISQKYPNAFSTNSEDINKISIGGSNDLGIDGISITLNDRLIYTIQDIDDILDGKCKADFHVMFIQSKNKSQFDSGEFSKFTNGILEFLQENIESPINDGVQYWHDIYKYIMTNDIMCKWKNNPSIECVYVTTGEWNGNRHIEGNAKIIKSQIENMKTFKDILFRYIDGKKLLNIVKENENSYTASLRVVDTMALPEVENVENSSVMICSVPEILKLMLCDGYLRRNLFEDNVRDYQGNTVINNEIYKTLEINQQNFVLLNNGITIVCDDMKEANRNITMENPQIVNGCQTCNVIYKCYLEKINLEKAFLIIKIISSQNESIVNSIIKGTNRQNIVYDEAFEVTRNFHKLLEDYFKSEKIGEHKKIYYERRSKQYDYDSNVKPYQKVNFKTMIQGFVGLFLYKPEDAYHHESKLLRDYKTKVFLDEHILEPYYLSAFMCLYFDLLRKRGKIKKKYSTYKYHIVLIFKDMLGGSSPEMKKYKVLQTYCKKIMEILATKDIEHEYLVACNKFDDIRDCWIKSKGEESKYHIKDNSEFTNFIISYLNNESVHTDGGVRNDNVYKGRIMNVHIGNKIYGFIEYSPHNIFFDKTMNPEFDFKHVEKEVYFEIQQKGERKYGVNVRYCEEK